MTTKASAASYRACRLFPGEVEDYFCMDCRDPCSALALLVGPHTNHRRLPFSEALLALPQECLTDATELEKCAEILLATQGPERYKQLRSEKAATAAEVEDIDRQIEELQQRKAELLRRAEAHDEEIATFQNDTLRRVTCLNESGEDQLAVVRRLKDMYSSQELAAMEDRADADTANANTVALSELRSVEVQLQAILHQLHKWQLHGGFRSEEELLAAGGGGVSGGSNRFGGPGPAVALEVGGHDAEEELIRHVLINQERLPHPQQLNTMSSRMQYIGSGGGGSGRQGLSSGFGGGGATAATTQEATTGRSSATNNARVVVPQPQPGSGDALDTLTAVLFAKRKASISPPTTDEEWDTAAELQRRQREIEKMQQARRRHSAPTRSPQRSRGGGLSSPNAKGSRRDYGSGAAAQTSFVSSEMSAVDDHQAAEVSATTTEDTTVRPQGGGLNDSSITAEVNSLHRGYNGGSNDSPSRYLRQFKRVRQCIRDALVADQQSLVTSLFHAIHELRREARRNGVGDVEKAIALDPELQDMM